MKRARETDHDRGEFQAESRLAFRAYAEEWIGRYQGTGRRGFRENTRADYRRDLERYAFPFLDERLGRTVSAITPRDVANWLDEALGAAREGMRWPALTAHRHGATSEQEVIADACRQADRALDVRAVCRATLAEAGAAA